MRFLLDTHVFLWWNSDVSKLSPKALKVLEDGENELFVSAASAWEIAIKAARGSLILPEAPALYLSSRIRHHAMQSLAIEIDHALHVYTLPPLHRDPFDRLLIAQSQIELLPLITADANIARYDITVVW